MSKSKIFIVVTILATASFGAMFAIPYSLQLGFSAPEAISLSASLNATTVTNSQTVRVNVTEQNQALIINDLALSGDWKVQNLSMGPCAFYNQVPFGIAVYQGRYTISNITSANSVQIYAPGSYFCQADSGTNSFRFQPLQSIGGYVDLRGYWTEGKTTYPDGSYSEGVLNPFLPGNYTLVAGDEWGHLQISYFEVKGIGLQFFELCSSNCVYPSPYLSGTILFDSTAPLKTLQLFVNGTDQGVQAENGISLTNFAISYKGGFQNPPVVKGNTYVLRFVATFEDESTASATTTVIAH